jgi:hypothetical protein
MNLAYRGGMYYGGRAVNATFRMLGELDSAVSVPAMGVVPVSLGRPITLASRSSFTSRRLLRGAIAEWQLVRAVSRIPDEVIIGVPGRMGTHGADLASFNRITGRVTLWDAKYRGSPRMIQMSRTFRKQEPLQNAVEEVLKIVRDPSSVSMLTTSWIRERDVRFSSVSARWLRHSLDH